MSTLFNVAVGLARQQMNEREMVRINPIVMDSDMSTNVIPNRMVVGTDLRAQSVEYIKEAAVKLDDAAKGSAMALQGEVNKLIFKHRWGTFLLNNTVISLRYLSEFVREAFEKNEKIDVLLDNNAISAGGDIGDLSFMIPCIQIGHSGFTGTIHGDDFIDIDLIDIDQEFLFEIFPEFLSQVFIHMSGKVDKNQLYKRSFTEYEALIKTIVD